MSMDHCETQNPSPNDWENPAIFGINKLKPHVPLRSYTDPSQAFCHYRLVSDDLPSPRQLSLTRDGDAWSFCLVDSPSKVPPKFWTPEFDCAQWDKVMPNAFCLVFPLLSLACSAFIIRGGA
jgi:beta-galactosidase